MELIKQSEIDKAIEKFDKEIPLGKLTTDYIFKAGVEFAQSKFEEMFIDIITENQGLKLYKDNETNRFEELAIEFVKWIETNKNSELTWKQEFKKFIKERNV